MNKRMLKGLLFVGVSSTLCMRIYDQRQLAIAKGNVSEDDALVDAVITFGSIPARTVRACARHISDFLDSDEKFRARQYNDGADDGIDTVG